jgi:hypothetical protein
LFGVEVIAGKSIPEEGAAKVFALVRRVDKKPKRRLRNVLESQGNLPRQQITFLSGFAQLPRLFRECESMADIFG